jgi:hypothetical protein
LGCGAEEEQWRTLLDTHVSYRFVVDGYPLVGPGAQIQISFAAQGEVTRLIHATRMLEPGPSVAIIDADTIRSRVACSLTDDVVVDVRLVYLAPSLRNALNSASYWLPSDIIPMVRGHDYADADPPRPGHRALAHLAGPPDSGHRRHSVRPVGQRLGKCPRGLPRQCACNCLRRHGTLLVPLGGSNPGTSTERGAAVSYEPLTRDLREILPSQSLTRTEHISVTVVDANGVSAQADTSLLVTAQPAPDTHNSVTYGCESPNDPGAWTGNRVAWQSGSAGSPTPPGPATTSSPRRPARFPRPHGSTETSTTATGASTQRTWSSTSATPTPTSSLRCIRAPHRPSTTAQRAQPFWPRTLRSPIASNSSPYA